MVRKVAAVLRTAYAALAALRVRLVIPLSSCPIDRMRFPSELWAKLAHCRVQVVHFAFEYDDFAASRFIKLDPALEYRVRITGCLAIEIFMPSLPVAHRLCRLPLESSGSFLLFEFETAARADHCQENHFSQRQRSTSHAIGGTRRISSWSFGSFNFLFRGESVFTVQASMAAPFDVSMLFYLPDFRRAFAVRAEPRAWHSIGLRFLRREERNRWPSSFLSVVSNA